MLIVSMLLLLLFTNIVTNSASEDNFSQQIGVTPSYRYNHPPLFEEYEVFPDPDEFEVRKVRDVESDHSERQENADSEIKKELFNKADTPDTSTQSKSHETLNSSGKNPVEIVNESPIKLIANSKLQKNNTINKVKRRKQRRRQNPVLKENVRKLKEETSSTIGSTEGVTEAPSRTSPSLKTIVPKIFTKRPPEDNPRIKKIRQRDPNVKILEATNFVYAHTGNFHYSYKDANGTKVSSAGELKSFDDNKTGESVVGEVSYKDNEGNDFSFSYTADENGYRAHGDHLPTPPPTPPAIARALKYLSTKTTPLPVTQATKKIDI